MNPRLALLAALLNIPSGVLIFGMLLYPIAYALWMSFHVVGIRELRTGHMKWVGLDNFVAVLTDPSFWSSFTHTVIFTVIAVALEVVLGLAAALAMNLRGIRLGKVTTLLMLVPWAIPPIVNGVMWSFIFNSSYGYVNAVLFQLGMIKQSIAFISDPTLALAVVIIAYVWRTVPFSALLLHASLQGISEEM